MNLFLPRTIRIICTVAIVALASISPVMSSSLTWNDVKKEVTHANVDNASPLRGAQNAIDLARALASGKKNTVKQVLGHTLLNTPGCLGCNQFARAVLPHLSNDQIDKLLGEGILTYIDGEAVVDMLDPNTGTMVEQKLSGQDNSSVPPAPSAPSVDPKARQAQTYFAEPECILEKNGIIWAGWSSDSVVFKDKTGKAFTYPHIDLFTGDTLKLSAHACPEWDNPAIGSKNQTAVDMIFQRQSSAAEPKAGMIWFYMSGNHRI